jgi:carbamoyltransferase
MIAWGINALNHGSSLAVFKGGKLQSLANCQADELNSSDITRALHYGAPDRIYWYERPWIKKARQLYAGQYSTVFDLSNLPKKYLKTIKVSYAPVTYTAHHASHAAAGYYTSPFNHCAIVVLDAIGEFECATIWQGLHGEMKKVWSRSYPHSLGIFYSAFTKLINLTPIKDEYLLQQMSDQGDPNRFYFEVKSYMDSVLNMPKNLHRGVTDWPLPIDNLQDQCDIAAAVQTVFEDQVSLIMDTARKLTGANSLVYMGGCAMNSKCNLKEMPKWKYVWSLPNPGDPSSSIGAVLYHTKQRVWDYKWDPVKHLEIRT